MTTGEAACSLAAKTAVMQDRLRILRSLQRRSEGIASVEVRYLLVEIAEEIQKAPIPGLDAIDATVAVEVATS